MIYDFRFYNKSQDESFFLFLIASQAQSLNLEAFFYTYAEHTHCLIPNIPALKESYAQIYPNQPIPSSLDCSYESESYAKLILEFANEISLKLPLSLYFYFRELHTITPPTPFYDTLCKESMQQSIPHAFPDKPMNIQNLLQDSHAILAHFHAPKTYYYTALETKEILNPSSDMFAFLNPPHSSMHKPLATQDKAYFVGIVDMLKEKQCVPFCTQRGMQILSLAPTPHTHTTILCDIASIKTYFRTHQSHIDTLASFEKPLTRLVPKEVFQEHFPIDECGLALIGLPYDMPLALIGALLLQDDISYFFLSYDIQHTYPTPFDFCHSLGLNAQTFTISHNGILIDTHITQQYTLESLINTHLYSHTQADISSTDTPHSLPHLEDSPSQPYLVIYLSTTHPSAFLIQEQKSKILLDISFECNPHLILQDIIHSYKSGDELIKSFGTHSPQLLKHIFALPTTPQLSHNLTDIFGILSFILGFSSTYDTPADKNALFYRAYRFVRERGPRIDYTLLRKDNTISLDYNRIVRSCISFKCADMDDEILAYGVLDSLSEFLATLVRDTKTNLAINNVLLLGDMLGNSIFLDRILGYLPKDIHLILPQDGKLDY
ncbi:hypothetical protein OQH61_02035 [Helicobacter sp. MIT 21-1697]|uniref:hypothetical protein n=1 Tax=Helicobacter sp. MIT 21-1697 TaxID=2993733 RepID=UPI00224AAC28|nr:hypothetical protein [Helicobacter sp. MIT 21-1697]MCX2716511.1 hypothetical protein [Helicobacter sp. MIT 21-1697]